MEAVFLDSENRLQISKKQKHLSEKELTEEQQNFFPIFQNSNKVVRKIIFKFENELLGQLYTWSCKKL